MRAISSLKTRLPRCVTSTPITWSPGRAGRVMSATVAVHLEGTVRPARRVQRAMQRERVRGPALLAIGSDHGHLAQRGAHLAQHCQAAGEDAIVVRDEDVHRAPKMIARA